MSEPLILITNDDGYDAPGLVAMYEAACRFGRVCVVAPKRERSACSHMITMHESIMVERIQHAPFGEVYTVTGTPADCVRLGATELLDRKPDLVLSGINRGANAGVDTFYSGTVAAAREGAILGIHAISVSHALRDGHAVDWSTAARATEFMITLLKNRRHRTPAFWSVNLPPRIPPDYTRRVAFVPVSITPMPMSFERTDHADGRTIEFRYGAYYWDRESRDHEDFSAIRRGDIAVSAIALATHRPDSVEDSAA